MVAPSSRNTDLAGQLRRDIDRHAVVSLQACAHCGLCTDQCHFVLTNPGDPTWAPAHKADHIRGLFKAHLGWTGRVFPWWVGARKQYGAEDLERLRDVVFGRCTNCQRCSVSCPMGVDMAAFNRLARGLLTHIGVAPEGFAEPAQDQWEVGNQLGIPPEEYLDVVQWIETELRTEYKDRRLRVPFDKTGADILYAISPREVRYDPRSLAEAAAIFHLAGENWTLAGSGWDVTNFGLFNGDANLATAATLRLAEAVERVGAKKLIVSEWGYGLRGAHLRERSAGGKSWPFEVESFVVTMLRYIEDGRIRVDPSRNRLPLTYHDPCTAARGFGMIAEPRRLLKAVCTDFREMQPNGAQNFCCTGGGGALFMTEYEGRRMDSAKIKADQLRATGARVVATSCQNCADTLAGIVRHYRLDMQVELLVNLVARALIVPGERLRQLEYRRILVVSEDETLRRTFAGVMRLPGCRVLEAADADDAVHMATTVIPDVIALDLALQGEAGKRLYMRFKADRRLTHTPIVVLTERGSIDRPFGIHSPGLAETNVARPDAFLNRPLNPEAVTHAIRKLPRRRGGMEAR